MNDEDTYDVVIDALVTYRDRIQKMTDDNMRMNMMNIMDNIRLENIDKLNAAITWWKLGKRTEG